MARRNVEYCKRWLRRHFPALHPVRIYFVEQNTLRKAYQEGSEVIEPYEDLDGLALIFDDKSKRFKIYIYKHQTIEKKILDILHEWSHVLRYGLPEKADEDSHDELWKAIHGKISRAWTGDDD